MCPSVSVLRRRGDADRFELLQGSGNEHLSHPSVQVNYWLTGFPDEIYAMLVVRLHHTEPFQQDQVWSYAADFKTNSGKQLGVKLTRRTPGVGELGVYFDPAVAMEEKIISGEPEQR